MLESLLKASASSAAVLVCQGDCNLKSSVVTPAGIASNASASSAPVLLLRSFKLQIKRGHTRWNRCKRYQQVQRRFYCRVDFTRTSQARSHPLGIAANASASSAPVLLPRVFSLKLSKVTLTEIATKASASSAPVLLPR